MQIADAMVALGYIVLEDEGGHLTDSGTRFLSELGIDLFVESRRRRRLCRSCLDWTERRPHIGGAVGAALTERWLALGWIERAKDSRAVAITQAGHDGFADTFGISL